MIEQIPDIIVPLISKGNVTKHKLTEELENKKVVIFGVPGAFTPTCSEKHLPDFISNYSLFKEKNIDDIYCLSVNDAFVMKAWLKNYEGGDKIIGIADGNGELSSALKVLVDKSANFMGYRSNRFAMIVINNKIQNLFIEKSGEYNVSSAEYILKQI
tara:strand:+ start:215 stop:685 length:471 start_codon:yes stop_codon:yes gene_type:complete